MQHQLELSSEAGIPMIISRVNKKFLIAWILVISLGALNFGLPVGQWPMYSQTFSCTFLTFEKFGKNDKEKIALW